MRAVRSDCTTQEPRCALRITRLLFKILLSCLRRTRLERKSTKNHSKIGENPSQIAPNSAKTRSWAVWGAQSQFGDASRRARDVLGTPTCRPNADLGTSRASHERPRAVQRRRRSAPEMLQEPPGHLPRRLPCHSRRQTQLEALADRFLIDFRSMRRSSEAYFVLVFTMFFRCRTFCASNACRTQKPRKNSRFGLQNRGPGRLGDPRASKFERQNGQDERRCASEVPPGPPKIFWKRERGNFERESASRAPEERAGPRSARRLISESSNGHFSYYWDCN